MNMLVISLLLLLRSLSLFLFESKVDNVLNECIVYQSEDGGTTWKDFSSGLPEELNVLTIYTEKQEVFLGSNKGLYKQDILSKERLWQMDSAISGNVTDIFPGKKGKYLRTSLNAIYQENVQSKIWTQVFKSLKGHLMSSVLETRSGDIFVSCATGIFKSSDEGKNWKQVFKGAAINNLIESDGIILGSGSDFIIRSEDNGVNWSTLLNQNGYVLKIGSLGNDLFIITSGKEDIIQSMLFAPGNSMRKEVHYSSNNGKTWFQREETLFGLDEFSNIVQLGELQFSSQTNGLYRSSNFGKSWELVLPSNDGSIFNASTSGNTIFVYKTFQGC